MKYKELVVKELRIKECEGCPGHHPGSGSLVSPERSGTRRYTAATGLHRLVEHWGPLMDCKLALTGREIRQGSFFSFF